MKFFIIIALQILIANANLGDLEEYCRYTSWKNELSCTNFTSLNQLNFQNTNQAFNTVILKPDDELKVILDSNLNLKGLKLVNDSDIPPAIVLANFYSFSANFNPFKDITLQNPTGLFNIKITDSEFIFKNDDGTDFECIYSSDDAAIYFFSDLNLDSFELVTKYPSDTNFCPILYKQSSVLKWTFNSFNPIYFIPLDKSLDLKINVERLIISFGYDELVEVLSDENLLNPILFRNIKALEIRQTYLERIDTESLKSLSKLKYLEFYDSNTRDILEGPKGEWLSALNWNLDKSSEVTRDDLFILKIRIDDFIDPIKFTDEDLCLFSYFPQDNYIVTLMNSESNTIDREIYCSCTIFWLYSSYSKFSHLITDAESEDFTKSFPSHCLKINPILFQEQIDYCKNEARISSECFSNATTLETTSFPSTTVQTRSPNCISSTNLCKCSFIDNVNILECSDPLLTEIPSDFGWSDNQIEWDYVSFIGSSIKMINQKAFKNLKLKENATLIIGNIIEFKNDIFSDETFYYDNKFRFVIEKSDLSSLSVFSPFGKVNFSELAFVECLHNAYPQGLFEQVNIDLFTIKSANPSSPSPFFSRDPPFKDQLF